jgi:hypothetical protein
MIQAMDLDRCATKRRRRPNRIVNKPHGQAEKHERHASPSRGLMARLVVNVLGKEGLEMLRHFFHMWCDKELPGIDSRNLHRPTP